MEDLNKPLPETARKLGKTRVQILQKFLFESGINGVYASVNVPTSSDKSAAGLNSHPIYKLGYVKMIKRFQALICSCRLILARHHQNICKCIKEQVLENTKVLVW